MTDSPENRSQRLDSWKEIAAHLNRDVRTVQRWEKSEGLPVRRHQHQRRGTVYAFRSELDAWQASRQPSPATSGRWRLWAAVVVAAGVAALVLWSVTSPAAQRSNEGRVLLAVLPFEALGSDPENPFFTHGLAEELIYRLGRIHPSRLGVIAGTSMRRFAERRPSIRELAEALQTDFVIEGSVRQEADRVRVTVRLIETDDASQAWSKAYERPFEGLLDLQSEISRDVASSLAIQLLSDRPSPLPPPPLEARAAYLRGRFFWNQATREGLEKAVLHLTTALEAHPDYSLALAGLADTYILQGDYHLEDPRSAYQAALQVAQRAWDLDPDSAEAKSALAISLHRLAKDPDRIEPLFRQATEAQPNHSMALRWFGSYLRAQERLEEAIREFRKALDVDPLSAIILLDIGWTLHLQKRFEEALDTYARVLELEPQHAKAHYLRGLTLGRQGRHREAVQALETAVPLSEDSPNYLCALGFAYANSGELESARDVLRRLEALAQQRFVPESDLLQLAQLVERRSGAPETIPR